MRVKLGIWKRLNNGGMVFLSCVLQQGGLYESMEGDLKIQIEEIITPPVPCRHVNRGMCNGSVTPPNWIEFKFCPDCGEQIWA